MTKREAAKHLGVSLRSLNRYVEQGRLTISYKRVSGRTTGFFDRGEVEALKKEQSRVPEPPKRKAEASTKESQAISIQPGIGSKRGEALALLIQAIQAGGGREAVRLVEKYTFNLPEAAQISGLSRGYLLEAIRAGKLKAAIRGKSWNVKRSDLETFIKRL